MCGVLKNVFNPEVGFFIHYIVTAESVMEKFVIEGGKKLYGNVSVSCAKNACLPLISASVLCRRVFLKSAPKIADVGVMCKLFNSLGGCCEFINGGIELKAENLLKYEPDEKMSKSIRASVFFLGSLLSRFKKDKIQKKPEKKLPKKQEIPQISAPQQKPKELKFDDTNSKVKTVLLEGHNEATKEEKNFNFNQLLFALLLIVFAVLLFVPQIYIRNNIYYLSREIAILRSQESVLSEENKEIRKALENMRFQNQILDYLE